MPKKILSHAIREQIYQLRTAGKSEREVAIQLGVTRGSVRRWGNRQSPDEISTAPKTSPEKIPPHHQLAIIECSRLLRWPIKELRSHLMHFFPEMDRPGRPGRVFKKQEDRGYRGIGDAAYYRVFKKAGLNGIGRRNGWPPGTVAVHGLKVTWQDMKGRFKEGWALILAERHSGYVNILIHRQLSPGMARRCIRSFSEKFEKMSGCAVKEILFVAQPDGQPVVPADLTDHSEPISKGATSLAPLKIKGRSVPCRVESPSTGHGKAFHLNGNFTALEQVRDKIKPELANFNQREGRVSALSKKTIESPLEKIFRLRCDTKKKNRDAQTLSISNLKRMMSQTGRNRRNKFVI